MNEDERYWRWRDDHDDYDYGAPKRKPKGCWCGLDGYLGSCPGAENCPYSGYHDGDEEGEDE